MFTVFVVIPVVVVAVGWLVLVAVVARHKNQPFSTTNHQLGNLLGDKLFGKDSR